MMSDSTKSSELQCFLNSWLETGAPAPQEIVIGYSYSMLDAASLAFNFSTFDNYNLRCYDYLINETSELPSTLIQIDVIGLIKVVDSWACFENILQPVKDFYLCSIMYLSTIDNLDIFRETIISILTMCQSPFQNKETESRRAALWVHLTTDTIQQMNQQYIQYVIGKNGIKSFSFLDIRQNAVIDDSCPHKIYDYINQLKMEAFEKCDFSMDLEKTPNDYYCPIVLENLIQLLIEFPSWTKIIKKSECSTLVSVCSTEHLSMLTEIVDPVHPSLFMVYHLDKIRSLMQLGKYFIKTTKDKNEFYKRDYKNNHTYLTQTISNNGSKLDNRIEINILNEKSEVNDEIELDLITFKNTILSTIHSLIDFDESVRNILRMQLNAEQETVICKIFLDCCAQMKTYEKFFGIIAGKFCSSSNAFANAFGQIIIECYNTVELFDKNELKNISKLFAHLLLTDTISWEILSVLKLHEKELTSAKKNFIRILLRELSEHMGVTKLQEKFRKKINTPALQGLFPNNTTKNANYAILFFKSIGLRYLGDILKENMKGESSKLKRSTSNSSISSTTSSCDFIIEVRVSKKNGDKKQLKDEKKKIIVIK
ncbi:PREDICTED: pre-mRNA-splicing factor CWC22 homolog [Ceratosolen solmsi marchali]|uniref:Pre-mRNA-splicing factor CWC22 homolog n=1 Tax=Ceratosolen solmsi marchali TaxID=326594 RepID=A0AAJ6YQ29_9HYME|nr:PREDICTED: pre-mRNA-splicing factor CWC22 homolog [Ceratosolen solmsi marchali]